VTEQEFLERLDAHMERGSAIMERSNELIVEHREFIREMTRRNERVTQELVREISAGRKVLLGAREVLVDLHRESYAQREAIWTLIDELRTHGLGGRG